MSFVKLNEVRKSYGPVEVLHGLNAEIVEGEFVAILGESGCGKSTLLRMIAGLEEVTSGEIEIDGKVVNNLSPRDRNIAMVFQSYALYPHMTVAQNICFPLQLAGVSEPDQKKQLNHAADMLNLGEYLDRKPRDLSGGQRQRVAMGRAIVRNPSVFLFDEPLSNLDAKLRVQMRADIRNLQQELGTTAIYVTHDQVEAMTMADRIILMNDGKIEQFGAPLELYDRPQSVFAAGFVGSPPINLIEGEILAGPEAAFVADGIRVKVPANVWSVGRATMGVRPDDIGIVSPDQTPAMTGLVSSVECTGERTNVQIHAQEAVLNMSTDERLSLAKGAEVSLQINAGKCLFFRDDKRLSPS
jgi:ABC-type sugar transport system ATPase subunit